MNQEERIEQLRKEREERNDKDYNDWLNQKIVRRSPRLKLGDPVHIYIDGNTMIGTFISQRFDRKKFKELYTLSTPIGKLTDVSAIVWLRVKKDLSNIEVPEELKKMSISSLKGLLKQSYSLYSYDYNSWSSDQIKAAMIDKGHFITKQDKRIKKKYNV